VPDPIEGGLVPTSIPQIDEPTIEREETVRIALLDVPFLPVRTEFHLDYLEIE
jgi:hypothetical protein